MNLIQKRLWAGEEALCVYNNRLAAEEPVSVNGLKKERFFFRIKTSFNTKTKSTISEFAFKTKAVCFEYK